MTQKPPPRVPAGSTFTGISDNLSFHSSPESFIASTVLRHHQDNPDAVQQRIPVRAKVLNRNVIVLSAYHHITQVLDAPEDDHNEPPFVAVAPYRQLMEEFFPKPNLLLEDGLAHHSTKQAWAPCAKSLERDVLQDGVTQLVLEFLQGQQMNTSVDLYEMLKDLSWDIFLFAFLGLRRVDHYFSEIVRLQEDLLRGQFSLFPVSVNVGLWHSPRSKGIHARKKLQQKITEIIATRRPGWLAGFDISTRDAGEMVNHALMATSSLAVKGFASLLLAFLLNMFLYDQKGANGASLSAWVESDPVSDRKQRLSAILNETIRLSPPIAGVMRRVTRETIIGNPGSNDHDVLIPKGFDVWSYFPGGNRDHLVFGKDANLFNPTRYLDEGSGAPSPIVFGAGAKTCLGASFVSKMATNVYEAFQIAGIGLRGRVENPGVCGLLGWQIAGPEEWAQGVKQLPTQRPAKPIMVDFVNNS